MRQFPKGTILDSRGNRVSGSSRPGTSFRNSFDALKYDPQVRQPKVSWKDADYDMKLTDRRKMISFGYDAYENAPLVKGMVNRYLDLVVGDGNRLQMNIKDKSQKKDIEDWFNIQWALDMADGRGRETYYDLQRIIFMEYFLTGDDFIWTNTADLNLYAYDAAQCLQPSDWAGLNTNTKNKCIDGVVVNPRGRTLKYYISPTAEAVTAKQCLPFKVERMIHLANRRRIRQVRGSADVLTIVKAVNQINDMLAAELQSAKSAAKFALAIKRKGAAEHAETNRVHIPGDDSTDIDDIDDIEVDEETGEVIGELPKLQNYDRLEEILAGAVEYLDEDDDIKIIENNRPSNSIEGFLCSYIRQIGAAVNLPLEILMLDFSQNSFSSNRASLMLAWCHISYKQQWWNRSFNRPVALRMLQAAHDRKFIKLPQGWEKCIGFSAPGIPSTDRWKDEKAKTEGLNNGTTTLQIEVAHSSGPESWQDIQDQRFEEKKRQAEKDAELEAYKIELRKKYNLENSENEKVV